MLKGSLVALVTPFDSKGKINYVKLEELLKLHLNSQTDGLVILGTTAEASTIREEEKIEMVRFCLDYVRKKIPVIVGIGSNDTAVACHYAEIFSKMGADYLLAITPYYNKTNPSGLKKHFLQIAEASKCPILLYNVPSRTGMSIPISVLKELAVHPKIAGIKEASGDMSYTMQVSELISDRFWLFSGNDDLIVPIMSMGGSGVISVLANIAPAKTHELCSFCLKNQYEDAAGLQKMFLPLIRALFSETNPIPIKAAMNYLGYEVGGYRLPLDTMDEIKYRALIKEIDACKTEVR